MRGHHEEAHVVDDLLRDSSAPSSVVALQSWVKISSPSLTRRAAICAAEIVDHELRGLDAASHLRARNGLAHDGDGGRDHVDEGASSRLNIRAHVSAEERDGGEIERQLFDRGIEEHVRRRSRAIAQCPWRCLR